MKYIIGIDPGKAGAICVIREGKIFELLKMPENNHALFTILSKYGKVEAHCFLEKVHAMPGQGVTSMFTFGEGYGALKMGLIANKIGTSGVTPQAWQKFYSFGSRGELSKTDWKKKLLARALELYPKNKISLIVADAVLIAHYGAQTFK